MMLALCSCAKREDYYVFSFNDYSITPGYDDVSFTRIAFDLNTPDTLEAYEELKEIDLRFRNSYFGSVDIMNPTNKQIDTKDGSIQKLTIYFNQLADYTFRIDGIELLDSVRENCDLFKGEYVERNGYACAFGKKVHGRKNIVILYGDIFAQDQDQLSHLEIYVEE